MNDILLALNICTYKKSDLVIKNLNKLLNSDFFDPQNKKYFSKLHIFVVDNASQLVLKKSEFVHLIYNKNTGGAGGFQRGLEEIRGSEHAFTHVIFMDDDVRFEIKSFQLLFDFLGTVDEINRDRPVAGRMFDWDNPNIQWTAAEIWNGGNIKHVEFLRNINEKGRKGESYEYGKAILDCDADYGGWWFCCYPMSFAKENDILPLFLHCDDAEYGLRCGRPPVIIEGVQVWHETWEKKVSPVILYYDTRNPLFVNEIYGLFPEPEQILVEWKTKISGYHVKQDWLAEYMIIRGLADYLKGFKWLNKLDGEKNHCNLLKQKGNRFKNALYWRITEKKFRKKFGMLKL